MIVTEEEAKNKLCPEAIGPGDLNWTMVPKSRMCIGSFCMAWRWRYHPDDNEKPAGYCGKAGVVI